MPPLPMLINNGFAQHVRYRSIKLWRVALCAPSGGAPIQLRMFARLELALAVPAVAAARFFVVETAKPRRA